MNPQNGLWILPSRGRPEMCKKWFEVYHETKATTPGLVVVGDETETEYDVYTETLKDVLPKNWAIEWFMTAENEKTSCFGASVRYAMGGIRWQDFDWLGLVTDDVLAVTPHWDLEMIKALNGKNFISTDDGTTQATHRSAGSNIWSVPLLRAVGYMFPPRLNHLFIDDVWESIGRATGTWDYLPNVLCEHHHWSDYATPGKKRAVDDTTKRVESFWDHDSKIYNIWLRNDFTSVVYRVKEFLQK